MVGSPVSGFMPIPLAMMIPFMMTQSMVMGDAFGRAFQYGKRKISAMSNEEFNATSLDQQASEMFQAYKNIIPKLEASMDDSKELQQFIIDSLLAMPSEQLASWFKSIDDKVSNIPQSSTPTAPAPTSSRSPAERPTTYVPPDSNSNKNFAPAPDQPPYNPYPSVPSTPSIGGQQQAEKTLVSQLLGKQKLIVQEITQLKSNAKYPAFRSLRDAVANANARLKAASLNLNKKQADYHAKYGIWLN